MSSPLRMLIVFTTVLLTSLLCVAGTASAAQPKPIGLLTGIPHRSGLFVYEGSTQPILAIPGGIGHVKRTVRPGQVGTAGLAGHRVSHHKPLYYLDELKIGDKLLYTPHEGRPLVFTVIGVRVVNPEDVWIYNPVADQRRMVVTACTPRGSDKQRLAVFLRILKEDS